VNPTAVPLSKIGLSFDIVSLISISISMLSVPGGYSFSKQAICHLGRMKVKRTGADNRIAAFFFFLFAFFQSALIFMNGWLALIYNLPIVAWACFICTIFSIFTGIIPIDIFERGHLNSALMGFILINFFLLILWVHTLQLGECSVPIMIDMAFVILWGSIYSIGYFRDYRYCGLFQKLWLINSIFVFNLFLDFLLLKIT